MIYWGIERLRDVDPARAPHGPADLARRRLRRHGVHRRRAQLPNSPGLVGQFHAAIKVSLLAYLPAAVVNARGIAYAIVLHGVQTIWYVATGLLSMLALSSTGAHVQ